MKTLELTAGNVGNLSWLTNQISGSLYNWKTAQKLDAKILLNEKELASVKNGTTTNKDGKEEDTYDLNKFAKVVEFSNDEFELLKTTLAALIEAEAPKNTPYASMKHLLNLDKLLNEDGVQSGDEKTV